MPRLQSYKLRILRMVAASSFWPDFMRNEAGNLICTYLAERGGAALGGFAGGAVGSYFGPAGAIPGRRIGASFGAAGGSSLAALWCPNTPPDSGEWPLVPPPTPDAGGMCDGVQYIGTYEYVYQNGGLRQENTFGPVWGPITDLIVRPFAGGSQGVLLCRGNGNGPQAPGTEVVIVSDSGQVLSSVTILSVTRVDGLPDNCGPPPSGPMIPGVPDDIPHFRDDPFARRPIDIDLDFGGPVINVNGDLVLDGPNIGPCGGLEICFEFDGIRFCIDPFGGIRVGPGARGGNDPPTGDPPPPQDDPRRVLTGVFYRTTGVGQGQSFETIGGEKYFYPRFGAITFSGIGHQSQPLEMRGEKGFIANPAPSAFDDYSFDGYQIGNTVTLEALWDLVAAPPTPEVAT